MATENTIAIRNIGTVRCERRISTGPGHGPKSPPTKIVTRNFPSWKIGRVCHDGRRGTRIGSFNPEPARTVNWDNIRKPHAHKRRSANRHKPTS